MLDIAIRYRIRSVDLIARLQHNFFLPDRSGCTHDPRADLVVRRRQWRYLHPCVSLFGEYLFGADYPTTEGRFPDAYLVRGLLGGVVPSRFGDLWIFMSADVGGRKAWRSTPRRPPWAWASR
jgi:hypothetical protein